jgi:hypothetical protein
MQSRYIVWQEKYPAGCRSSVRDVLRAYPNVAVLKSSGPDRAVVLMDDLTERRIRAENPGLSVEPDVQHRMASRW